jgi:hypothetical protein
MVPDCSLSSVSAGGATGGCAGTATAASARYGARLSAITLAHGGKEGESTMGVHPLTLNTGYRIIGLAHRAQDIELALTIVTGIFVDRHSDHLLQLFSITFYLSLLIWSSPGIRKGALTSCQRSSIRCGYQVTISILSRPKRSGGRIEGCGLFKALAISTTRTLRYAASPRFADTQDAPVTLLETALHGFWPNPRQLVSTPD